MNSILSGVISVNLFGLSVVGIKKAKQKPNCYFRTAYIIGKQSKYKHVPYCISIVLTCTLSRVERNLIFISSGSFIGDNRVRAMKPVLWFGWVGLKSKLSSL